MVVCMSKTVSAGYQLPAQVLESVQKVIGIDMDAAANLFKVLSDPTRLRILRALQVNELCVCILVGITDYQYSALSYHLKLLKDVGLVDFRKEGNFCIYRLTDRGSSLLRLLDELGKI